MVAVAPAVLFASAFAPPPIVLARLPEVEVDLVWPGVSIAWALDMDLDMACSGGPESSDFALAWLRLWVIVMSMCGVSMDLVIDLVRVVAVPPSVYAAAPDSLPADVLVPSPLVAVASAPDSALTAIDPSPVPAVTPAEVSAPAVVASPFTSAVEAELVSADTVVSVAPAPAASAAAAPIAPEPEEAAAAPEAAFAAAAAAFAASASWAGLCGIIPAIRNRPSTVEVKNRPILRGLLRYWFMFMAASPPG
jgi:hypothetical protein